MKVLTNGCKCQHHTYTDKTGLPFKCKSKRHSPARKGEQKEGALICSQVGESVWAQSCRQEKKCVLLLTIPTGSLETQTCAGLKSDLYLTEVKASSTCREDYCDQSAEEILIKPWYARHSTERNPWHADSLGAFRTVPVWDEKWTQVQQRYKKWNLWVICASREKARVSMIRQWSIDSSLTL